MQRVLQNLTITLCGSQYPLCYFFSLYRFLTPRSAPGDVISRRSGKIFISNKNSEVVNKNFTALRLILHYTSLRTSPHFTTHFTNFTFKFQGVTMGVTWKGERGQPPYFTGFREFQPTSIPITSHASASFRRKGVSARCFLCLKIGILDGTVVVHTIDNRALHEYCLFRFFTSPPAHNSIMPQSNILFHTSRSMHLPSLSGRL